MSVIYGSLNGVSNFRLHGFATGNYLQTCSICKKSFTGDKLAFQCLDCALVYERVCECKNKSNDSQSERLIKIGFPYCPACGGKYKSKV